MAWLIRATVHRAEHSVSWRAYCHPQRKSSANLEAHLAVYHGQILRLQLSNTRVLRPFLDEVE